MRGISPVTDFFVLATGTSGRQMRSVADEIEELGEPRKFIPFGRNGHEGETWVLTDFVDVVLHVFSPDSQKAVSYDLDGLVGRRAIGLPRGVEGRIEDRGEVISCLAAARRAESAGT